MCVREAHPYQRLMSFLRDGFVDQYNRSAKVSSHYSWLCMEADELSAVPDLSTVALHEVSFSAIVQANKAANAGHRAYVKHHLGLS